MQAGRCDHRRFLTLVFGGVLLLSFGGCPCLETTLDVVADVDFQELHRLATLVHRATELNAGTTTEDQVCRTCREMGTLAEFHHLRDVDITYGLLTNHEQQTHTILLPGTANLENIRLDLQFDLELDDELGVRLHAGFREGASAVRDDLLPRMAPSYRVTVVGYSLGGAVACIVSLHLHDAGFDIEHVLTFGQPALTDEEGAKRFAVLPLLRVISGDDVIVLRWSEEVTQFGPALTLLDGPYVVRIPAETPIMDSDTAIVVSLSEAQFGDHLRYLERTRVKAEGVVYEVSYVWRDQYIHHSGPEE